VIDATLRRKLSGSFNWLALKLDNGVITPTGLTVVGLLLGMASAASAWNRLWVPALLLWLTSRVLDALDGALARIKISHNISYGSVGGYLDIVFDFIVYGSFVVGVGHGAGTSYLPFLLVLLAYYINGTSFLAFSSIAEREQITIDDGRSRNYRNSCCALPLVSSPFGCGKYRLGLGVFCRSKCCSPNYPLG
jgi:phosphatidylglycerophosphate synthase